MPANQPTNWAKWITILLLLAAAGGGGWYYYFKRPTAKEPEYRTAKISTGDITQSVTANGQITPVRNVEVGSQVSGILTEVKVDFNSPVKQGEVLAKIDPATYERALARAEAELSNSKASLELATFTKRAKDPTARNWISKPVPDGRRYALCRGQWIARPSERESRSTGRRFTVGGIVIRNIEVGQTVASSFNTPRLLSSRRSRRMRSTSRLRSGRRRRRSRPTGDLFRGCVPKPPVQRDREAGAPSGHHEQNVVNYTAVVSGTGLKLVRHDGQRHDHHRGEERRPAHSNTAVRFTPPKDAASSRAATPSRPPRRDATKPADRHGGPRRCQRLRGRRSGGARPTTNAPNGGRHAGTTQQYRQARERCATDGEVALARGGEWRGHARRRRRRGVGDRSQPEGPTALFMWSPTRARTAVAKAPPICSADCQAHH